LFNSIEKKYKRKMLVLVILRLVEFHFHLATSFVKKAFEMTVL